MIVPDRQQGQQHLHQQEQTQAVSQELLTESEKIVVATGQNYLLTFNKAVEKLLIIPSFCIYPSKSERK